MLPRVRQAQPLRSPACSPARPRTVRPYRWEGGIAPVPSPYFGVPPPPPPSLVAWMRARCGALSGKGEGGGGGPAQCGTKVRVPPSPYCSPQTALGDRHGDGGGGGHGLHADPFSFSGVPRSGGAHTGGSARAAALRAVGVSFGAVRVCGAGIPGAVLSPCVGMDASGGVAAAAGTAGRRARS